MTAGDPNDADDLCTVYDDDNLSLSGFSDLRSQRSGLGGRGGRNQGVDLFQNIIEEEEDEDGLDVSEDRDQGEHEGGVPSSENQNEGGANPDESVAQDKTQVI